MEKIDLKRSDRALYAPKSGDFQLVTVPELRFLMVDGSGDPNTAPAYSTAVESLYAASYALKFHSKGELERDYTVMPLEGLWWSDDPSRFTAREKDAWSWTMMIRQPEWLDQKTVAAVLDEAAAKKKLDGIRSLRHEAYDEGLCVQIMHVGSYDDEAPTLASLHDEFIPANGLRETGHHHEIYLGDPRKTEPAKLKTILRQPVELPSIAPSTGSSE